MAECGCSNGRIPETDTSSRATGEKLLHSESKLIAEK